MKATPERGRPEPADLRGLLAAWLVNAIDGRGEENDEANYRLLLAIGEKRSLLQHADVAPLAARPGARPMNVDGRRHVPKPL